eukprot:scaffold16092_cov127-Isochrysis_galbana.AAC.1
MRGNKTKFVGIQCGTLRDTTILLTSNSYYRDFLYSILHLWDRRATSSCRTPRDTVNSKIVGPPYDGQLGLGQSVGACLLERFPQLAELRPRLECGIGGYVVYPEPPPRLGGRGVGSRAVPRPPIVNAAPARPQARHRGDEVVEGARVDALTLGRRSQQATRVAVEETGGGAAPAVAPRSHPHGHHARRRKVEVRRVAVEDERRCAGRLGPHLILREPRAALPPGKTRHKLAQRRRACKPREGGVALPHVDQVHRPHAVPLARKAEGSGALWRLWLFIWRHSGIILAPKHALQPMCEQLGCFGRDEPLDHDEPVGAIMVHSELGATASARVQIRQGAGRARPLLPGRRPIRRIRGDRRFGCAPVRAPLGQRGNGSRRANRKQGDAALAAAIGGWARVDQSASQWGDALAQDFEG